MSQFDRDVSSSSVTIDPTVARRVVAGALALVAVSALVFLTLRRNTPPPPPEIVGDPRLVAGREVFLGRCASCHGEKGRGDGPIAKGLAGPPVGDLTDRHWKHGERPEDVLRVVREGVPNTSMAGWGRVLGEEAVQDVTAYVFHLAGRKTSGLGAPDRLSEDGTP